MRSKKIRFGTLFLILLICGLSLGTLFSSPTVLQNNNFTGSPKSSAGEITIVTPENKTYTQSDSGYYPASYGFENDLDASIPQSWVDNSQSGCIARVVSEKTGHKKVVHLDDDSGNKIYFDHYFPAQTHGTIELWVLAEDATSGFAIRTFGPADHMVYVDFGNQDKWNYVNGAGATTAIPTYDGVYDPVDNMWYHLTIHFRCNNSPNYMGLNENSYKIIVDDLESIELEASFGNIMNSVDRFDIATGAASSTDGWVDAISFSWDPSYNIGDNMNEGLLLSYDNSTTLDWQGYSLDGQVNKTILGNTTIPMPSDGLHSIQIFGNDTMGTMYESDIRHFTVDTIPPPEISITYPSEAQEFSAPPAYILSINGTNIDAQWYTLNGGIEIPFTESTGTISTAAWNALPNGPVTIRFTVRDIALREAFDEVIVVKLSSGGTTPPPAIPGYNLFLIIGVISVISTLIVRRRLKS